jgi:regulator of sigma E protease
VAGKRRTAAALDLELGDRLLAVGERPILRPGDLQLALLAAAEGTGRAAFSVEREGRRFGFDAPVASRAEALQLASDIALETDVKTTAILVNPGEPAALAGARDLDRVLRVNGSEVAAWEDTRRLIKDGAEREEPLVVTVLRLGPDGERPLELTFVPAAIPSPDYGFQIMPSTYVFRTKGLGEAVRVGAVCSWRFAQETVLTLKRFMTRDVEFKNAGGIISIGVISYSFAESGWTKLFFFLCLLSINLAILNVLPIPVLDGGHLLFLIVEKVKGSPVSERILVYSQVVGFVLILSLILIITYNDLVRWVLPPG